MLLSSVALSDCEPELQILFCSVLCRDVLMSSIFATGEIATMCGEQG